MNQPLKHLITQLRPFIILGISITVVICLMILFFYVFLWGALLGTVIWLMVKIKNYFSPPTPKQKPKGRIIEHD